MANKIQSFEQLNVWQGAMDLAVKVYGLSAGFPKQEQFALTNQLRRAGASISANIAEGFGRQTSKEKLQFYSIAYGSLLETKSFLYLAQRLSYIDKPTLDELLNNLILLQKQLNALRKAVKDA